MSELSMESLLFVPAPAEPEDISFEGYFESDDENDPEFDPTIFAFEGMDALRESDVAGAIIESTMAHIDLLDTISAKYSNEAIQVDHNLKVNFIKKAKEALVKSFKELGLFLQNLVRRFLIWIQNLASDSTMRFIQENKSKIHEIEKDASAKLPQRVNTGNFKLLFKQVEELGRCVSDAAGKLSGDGKGIIGALINGIKNALPTKMNGDDRKAVMSVFASFKTTEIIHTTIYGGPIEIQPRSIREWLNGDALNFAEGMGNTYIKEAVRSAKELQKAVNASISAIAAHDEENKEGMADKSTLRLAASRVSAYNYQAILEAIRYRGFVVKALKTGLTKSSAE